MEVIIVSKTKMASNDCVGGIVKDSGQFIRLLDSNGNNQPIDCDFEVGEIWEIEFTTKGNLNPPHTEDVLVTSMTFTKSVITNLVDWVTSNFKDRLWRGSPDNIFDSQIDFTPSGSGFISASKGIPNLSVGFWISDKDLTRRDFSGKVRYNYPSTGSWRNITYVGKADPIDRIPAGTLMRVSLARWWAPDNSDEEERCYLQLSGWYLD
jgi:hypothetical protein